MLSNVQIREFMEKGMITITPFNPKKLGPTFYRLSLSKIRWVKYDENGLIDIGQKDLEEFKKIPLNGKSYAVCEIKEKIVLNKGFVGSFFPASLLIEDGLILNYGHLQADYIDPIVFGIFNARPMEFLLEYDMEIARISFEYLGENVPINYEKQKGNTYDEVIELVRSTQEEINVLEKAKVKKSEEIRNLLRKLGE